MELTEREMEIIREWRHQEYWLNHTPNEGHTMYRNVSAFFQGANSARDLAVNFGAQVARDPLFTRQAAPGRSSVRRDAFSTDPDRTTRRGF